MILKDASEAAESVTDYPAWITAITALIGIPLTLVSIIKLVSRDKDCRYCLPL